MYNYVCTKENALRKGRSKFSQAEGNFKTVLIRPCETPKPHRIRKPVSFRSAPDCPSSCIFLQIFSVYPSRFLIQVNFVMPVSCFGEHTFAIIMSLQLPQTLRIRIFSIILEKVTAFKNDIVARNSLPPE